MNALVYTAVLLSHPTTNWIYFKINLVRFRVYRGSSGVQNNMTPVAVTSDAGGAWFPTGCYLQRSRRPEYEDNYQHPNVTAAQPGLCSTLYQTSCSHRSGAAAAEKYRRDPKLTRLYNMCTVNSWTECLSWMLDELR